MFAQKLDAEIVVAEDRTDITTVRSFANHHHRNAPQYWIIQEMLVLIHGNEQQTIHAALPVKGGQLRAIVGECGFRVKQGEVQTRLAQHRRAPI